MKKISKFFCYVFIVCLFCLYASQVFAEYPLPSDNFINDFAVVLSPEQLDDLARYLYDVQSEAGLELVVVTMESVADFSTRDRTVDSFANSLFNYWGLGGVRNSVMIVLSVYDRQCSIKLGHGYSQYHQTRMKKLIDHKMIPLFMQGDFGRGVLAGAGAVVHELKRPGTFWELYQRIIISGFILFFMCFMAVSYLFSGSNGFAGRIYGYVLTVIKVFFSANVTANYKGQSFGGGRSFGGGACGSW